MANEHAKEELAHLLSSFDKQVRVISEIHERRARLTATGIAAGKRVKITLNADGTVIETRFSPDIGDLDPAEMGRAVTEAAQRATEELAHKTEELMKPLLAERAQLPKLSDMIEGMPDLGARLPVRPQVSTAPPDSPERRHAAEPELRFDNVEEIDFDGSRPRFTDSGW